MENQFQERELKLTDDQSKHYGLVFEDTPGEGRFGTHDRNHPTKGPHSSSVDGLD